MSYDKQYRHRQSLATGGETETFRALRNLAETIAFSPEIKGKTKKVPGPNFVVISAELAPLR